MAEFEREAQKINTKQLRKSLTDVQLKVLLQTRASAVEEQVRATHPSDEVVFALGFNCSPQTEQALADRRLAQTAIELYPEDHPVWSSPAGQVFRRQMGGRWKRELVLSEMGMAAAEALALSEGERPFRERVESERAQRSLQRAQIEKFFELLGEELAPKLQSSRARSELSRLRPLERDHYSIQRGGLREVADRNKIELTLADLALALIGEARLAEITAEAERAPGE